MRRRGWLIAAAVVLLLALAGWLASDPLLRRLVVDEARQYRVALEFEKASYSRERIVLEGCTVTLLGVPGVTARIERLTVELEDWKARAIDAQGVSVVLDGSSVELVRLLRAWGQGNALPSLTATLERVSWTRDGVEWLRLEHGKLDAPASELSLDAEQLTLFARDVGPMVAHIASGRAYVSLGLGGDAAAAPVRLVAEIDREPFEADIALEPTPLARLAGPLAVAL
ncbi:MAG TPA: hypothetical protein VFB62_15510, partial [Polyangiaceae bacterium]|nr:hypothetical protein [Polyangiaceae bacterium]